jgi:hypothetical protein
VAGLVGTRTDASARVWRPARVRLRTVGDVVLDAPAVALDDARTADGARSHSWLAVDEIIV